MDLGFWVDSGLGWSHYVEYVVIDAHGVPTCTPPTACTTAPIIETCKPEECNMTARRSHRTKANRGELGAWKYLVRAVVAAFIFWFLKITWNAIAEEQLERDAIIQSRENAAALSQKNPRVHVAMISNA